MLQYSLRNDIVTRKTAFIVMLLLTVLGIELGMWQLRRAQYKENLATEISTKEKDTPLAASEKKWTLPDAQYHQMIADGQWLSSEGVWLDNRPHPQGRDPKTGITTGFILLMPLKISVNQRDYIVWVNRGWAPRSFTQREVVPSIPSATSTVQVRGIVMPDAGKTFALGQESNVLASDGRKLVQNFVIEQASQPMNLPYHPFILRQMGDEPRDGLDRNWPAVDYGVSKHQGYALQWFALAGMTFLFWLITGIRKQSKRLG